MILKNSRLFVPIDQEDDLLIHLTYSYKYLGTILDQRCNFHHEIKVRSAIANNETHKFVNTLSKQSPLAKTAITNIVNAVVYPKLLYNSHAWWPITTKDYQKLQHTHIKTQRRLHRLITTATSAITYSNDQVRAMSNLPDVGLQITYSHLLFSNALLYSLQPLLRKCCSYLTKSNRHNPT